jgi:hypothetical protein
LPAAQLVQMDAPAPLYLPLLHWEHEVVPEDEDVPAAHSRQLVASVLAYLRRERREEGGLVRREGTYGSLFASHCTYLPAGQLEQDVAPSE